MSSKGGAAPAKDAAGNTLRVSSIGDAAKGSADKLRSNTETFKATVGFGGWGFRVRAAPCVSGVGDAVKGSADKLGSNTKVIKPR